ncbi:MAG TPA: type II secretion system protein GspK [Xanthobacteraceae bacterium]|nr:type II secretion system protein GspK [Xanthobacteraceae bacterium]
MPVRLNDGASVRRRPKPTFGRSRRNGFIIVVVLWMLAALATLAGVASAYVAQSAVALTVNDDVLQSEAAIIAGLELTALRLSVPAGVPRPTRGGFRFRLAGGEIVVEFVSEAARIDLNAAPKNLIAGLFTILGARAEAADNYAERIVKWRARPKTNGPDEEEALYLAAGLGYPPRRAPFHHLDELWLVQGIPPALVEHALPFVTIYSGMRQVNVLDAPPEVVAALPDMTPGRLHAFLDQRDRLPADPAFVAGALGDKQVGATTRGSDAYRVRLLTMLPRAQHRIAEVVIMVQGPQYNEPYRILSWIDDIDRATGGRRRPAETR